MFCHWCFSLLQQLVSEDSTQYSIRQDITRKERRKDKTHTLLPCVRLMHFKGWKLVLQIFFPTVYMYFLTPKTSTWVWAGSVVQCNRGWRSENTKSIVLRSLGILTPHTFLVWIWWMKVASIPSKFSLSVTSVTSLWLKSHISSPLC